jgi:2-polyprenyl-3-methyl-5-hydroxy-6-metoxy-1,4-benzoquinol methylase
LKDFDIDVSETVQQDVEYLKCLDCSLLFFSPQFAGDENFYAKLQKQDWYYLKDKFEFQFASQLIQPNSSVLEIGAGEGNFRTHLRHANYVGLEFSAAAIKLAEDKGLKLLKETIEEHSMHNRGVYDVVCTFQVLEHVRDIYSFVKCSARCLRSKGLFLISVPAEDSFMSLEVNNVLNMPPHHQTRWTDEALRNMARSHGFDVKQITHEPLSESHIGAFAAAFAHSGWAEVLRRQRTAIDPFFRSLPGRILSSPVKSIIRGALRRSSWRPNGHTVCIALEKVD